MSTASATTCALCRLGAVPGATEAGAVEAGAAAAGPTAGEDLGAVVVTGAGDPGRAVVVDGPGPDVVVVEPGAVVEPGMVVEPGAVVAGDT